MSTLNLDFSGRKGLVQRHQGDLNDTTAKPHLRYLGEDGQIADGIFNPFKQYGYMSPANDTFADLTGITTAINQFQYDSQDDILYASEAGENILQLDGLDDTSFSNFLSVTAGYDIKDILLYEVDSMRALIYLVDSNDTDDGMFVGFKMLDSDGEVNSLETDYGLATDARSQSDQYTLDDGSSSAVKLAQPFKGSDLGGLTFNYITLSLRRTAGTGSGITMKVSIQGNHTDRDATPYTYQGAWTDNAGAGQSYSVNDTVEHNDVTYACIADHTSSDNGSIDENEPGNSDNWTDVWTLFEPGFPNGTEIVSATFSLSDVPSSDVEEYRIDVTETTLSSSTTYWLVIEESGSNMTSSDELTWRGTGNGTGDVPSDLLPRAYDGADDYWQTVPNYFVSFDDESRIDSFGFQMGRAYTQKDNWTSTLASGSFTEETGKEGFLRLSDNGLVYWVSGREIHLIDGTSTGGDLGRVNEAILSVPSYMNIVDIEETRTRMYIALQSSDKSAPGDDRVYPASRSGVYIWDRRTQIIGSADFYYTPGAKEIKKLFASSTGDILAITVGNSGFSEIRGVAGNQYAVLQTFEIDGYPDRRGVSQINDMSIWLGKNGIFYAYGSVAPGEAQQLYKIGTMASEASTGLSTGPIFVGNENSTQQRMAVLLGWSDSTPTVKVQKWYPIGEGTINSVAQTGNQGDVFTPVVHFGTLAQVNFIRLYCKPVSSTGDTVIATLKCYVNHSSMALWSKSITQKLASDGFVYFPIGRKGIHSIQFELEFSTSQTLGADDFCPYLAELDYDVTERKK